MIVETENLTHRYGERVALAGLSFRVGESEIYGLLGPNGGGKSTLFGILSTMQWPTEGTVRIAGFDVLRQPDEVRRRIGVVFQASSVDKKLTVEENLRAQGRLYGLSGKTLAERVERNLGRLGLAARRRELTGTLSGGLRRRVEIAKALLNEPPLLLLDEPSTGLDPAARLELWQYLAELRRERRMTVLLTTHILEEAEKCDRLLLLHQGRRVAEGTPAELKARVGGDVLVLGVADAPAMRDRVRERFGVEAQAADGHLRLEIANAHKMVAELVEAFPGAIESVALHKPTLEDVFLHETGVGIE